MTYDERKWFCKLAFMIVNALVYVYADAAQITYWRGGKSAEVRRQFDEHADNLVS
jgi:hypothetical protein